VSEDHDDVVHTCSPIAKVGVGSSGEAKLKPRMVTEDPPEEAALPFRLCVIAGPSYVKPVILVPTTAETVTTAVFLIPVPGYTWQLTAVSLLQIVVEHKDSPTTELGVALLRPKLVPTIVIVFSPLVGALNVANDSTGASKEKLPPLVPTIAAIVTVP
jgi:hypothetical protein